MPQEMEANVPEQTESEIPTIKVTLAEMKSRSDDRKNVESDSNTDDGSLTGVKSKEDLVKSTRVPLLQTMSVGSDTSAVSDESWVPKSADQTSRTRSSSASSHLPTSGIETDSDDDYSEYDPTDVKDIINDFENLRLRNKRDDNYNFSNPSESEEGDVSNESDSEDDGAYIARGRKVLPREIHTVRDNPYGKNRSPRVNVTNTYFQPANDVSSKKPAQSKVDSTACLSYTSIDDEFSALDDFLQSVQLPSDFDGADLIFRSPYIDQYDVSAAPNTIRPIISMACYDENGYPSSSMSSIESSTMLQPHIVKLPLSSTSSSNVSDNGERSPASYYSEIDSVYQDGLSGGMRDVMNHDSTSIPESTMVFDQNVFEGVSTSGQNESKAYTTDEFLQDALNVVHEDMSKNSQQGEQQYPNISDLYHQLLINPNINELCQYSAPNEQLRDNSLTGTTQDLFETMQNTTNMTQCSAIWISQTNPESTSRGKGILIDTSIKKPDSTAVWQENPTIQPNIFNTNHTLKLSSNANLAKPVVNTDHLIPETVNLCNQSSSLERSSGHTALACRSFLGLSTKPAEKLKVMVGDDKLSKAMIHQYEWNDAEYVKVDGRGDTRLMKLVRDPQSLKKHLAHLVPMIENMKEKSGSPLIMRNCFGEDALYLAAINCPEFDYVISVLISAIVEAHGAAAVSGRRYNRNYTLFEAVAAKGDSHAAILKELLNVNKTVGYRLFDLSAQNSDGTFDLESIGQVTNDGRHPLRLLQMPVISKYSDYYWNTIIMPVPKNTITEIHLYIQHVELSIVGVRVTQRLTSPIKPATLQFGLATVSNPVHRNTQVTVCRPLMDGGGWTNHLSNLQHRMSLKLVAADQRETLKKIFYKNS